SPDENWGYRLAAQVPDVDVIILGHTHTVVAGLVAGGTLCTQAGKWGEQLGRVDLTLNRAAPGDRWHVAQKRSSVIPVTSATPDAPAIAALAEPYHRATPQV